MYCFFNNGLSNKTVANNYQAQSGETLFETPPTQEQLATAFSSYVIPTPTPLQLALNAISAGIILTSTGTPALNGTYDIDQSAQNNINAVITFILVNSTFPGGGSTFAWYDSTGGSHTFPSTDEFKAFATAIANFVAQVAIYANSNGSVGSIPSNAITIA